MANFRSVNKSVPRRESWDKVTGKQKYLNDFNSSDLLYGALKLSNQAHAKIVSIDISRAKAHQGVRKVLTGDDIDRNLGLYLGDKPAIAKGKVRHHGETVALVIADTLEDAEYAVNLIDVVYETLEAVSSPLDALKEDAPVIHEDLGEYNHIDAIIPEPGTNVANRTKIRKGDWEKAMSESDFTVEDTYSFPPGDHVAMEPRVAMAKISSDGYITIHSSTQAPYVVKELLSKFFDLDPGKITIIAPPVGGGFGGKAGIQLEGLAYLASKAAGGRPVKITNSREADMMASPGHIGLQAKVKIGANKDGKIMSGKYEFIFDSGAYADYAVNISRAAAISCTGPYNVENVFCDSICAYTNHPFATAYRGFGHIELAFAVERILDKLADKLGIDPLELRQINSIKEGHRAPTSQKMNKNTGDLVGCLEKVKETINWSTDVEVVEEGKIVRAKGVGCLWKAPAMPTTSDAGAILTFNEDGTINVNTGIVEIGQGTKTGIAQIVAEKFKTTADDVHVIFDVNTSVSPHDWATAASRGLMMGGMAASHAADDALKQIKRTASIPLRCAPHDLEVENGMVFLPDEPEVCIPLSQVVHGYMYPNGNAIEGQIIGRGRYISRRLSFINPETGEGEPALEYVLGAQAAEVEVNLIDGSYKVINFSSCMDVGKVINPDIARGQVVGAIGMGVSFTRFEGFEFNSRELIQNNDLRLYKIMRYDDEPNYNIDFLTTPQMDGPYGARGLGEQGIIGVPGAITNALSRALGKDFNHLPVTPEAVWKKIKEDK